MPKVNLCISIWKQLDIKAKGEAYSEENCIDHSKVKCDKYQYKKGEIVVKNSEAKKERKYYLAGKDKPPIFIQAILYEKKMSVIDFFHLTDAYLNWEKKEDDFAVIEPLITFLATWGDDLIFAFHDRMSELLYSLDTRKIAGDIYKDRNFSPDDFLYIRCTALINSKRFYNDIINGRKKLKDDLTFEAILYVPALAWERLHRKNVDEYPYTTKYSYETMSNFEGWKED